MQLAPVSIENLGKLKRALNTNNMNIYNLLGIWKTPYGKNNTWSNIIIDKGFTGSYRGSNSDVCGNYNEYLEDPSSWPFPTPPPECFPEIQDNYPVGTKAEYFQYILELEYPIFLDIQLSAQFIFHDLVKISTGLPGESEEDKIVSLQTEIDLLPEHNFIPGLGAPLTIFTLEDHPEWGSQGTVYLVKSRTVYLNF